MKLTAIYAACSLGLLACGMTSTAANAEVSTATTRYVMSCEDDGGAQTARSVIQQSTNGDIVDFGNLSCSKISLINGAITFTAGSITLQGATTHRIAIDAGGTDRVLGTPVSAHGTLRIFDLTLSNGYTSASGGCLSIGDSLSLTRSEVSGCRGVFGAGGVSVQGDLTLDHSQLLGNSTNGTGGGAGVGADLTAKYSTVSGNSANLGGGLYVLGSLTMAASTVSGNTANSGAGIVATAPPQSQTLTNVGRISDSTLSANIAKDGYGGLLFSGKSLFIGNSTIAFNQVTNNGGLATQCGGVTAGPFELESSILSNNLKAGVPSDLCAHGGSAVTGHNNIIVAAFSNIPLPTDTISADPHLFGLSDNGGPTQTHAIPISSLAIDGGNTVSGVMKDQRGLPRIDGAAADIGAYEHQAELIFADGFQ